MSNACVPRRLSMPLTRYAAALLLALCAMPAAPAASAAVGQPRDPLFNLPYNPAQIRFEAFDPGRLEECTPLTGDLGARTGHVKLFGKLESGRTRILVVGDEDPQAPRGLSGLVLVVKDGGCKMSGPLAALRRIAISDPDLDPGLSAADVTGLMNDMFARYSRAFGSKAEFLDWTDRLTSSEDAAHAAAPGSPCPLLYTSMFSQPMRRVFAAFRATVSPAMAFASR